MQDALKKIHFVGIGGVGMGTFAVALAGKGYEVTGSDGTLYEPMKSVLQNAHISLIEGHSDQNLKQVQPDLVVVGNVIRKDNAEARAWIHSGTKFMSFPEAVRSLLIEDRKSIVIAGTHGKTTTTSWVAYLLKELGTDPSYLIGGVPLDLPGGCALTSGTLFAGEGDEYDSAFFDKGPKFLHYNPSILILTSIEFDHADIYKDLAHVQASFEKLVALLPGDGLLIARYDDPTVMAVLPGALCPIQTFGTGPGAMWKLGKVEESEDGLTFEAIYKNRSFGQFRTPLLGDHNLLNLLSGIICAVNLGYSIEKIKPIVEKFRGVKRRQQVLLRKPITLVDDFAHHPTEVAATLKGVRRRFPTGTLWAIFEARSATARRNVHQAEYGNAFESADQVLVCSHQRTQELDAATRFSSDTLVDSLKAKNKAATAVPGADEAIHLLLQQHSPGDVVVVMSNGEFDKIQDKIIKAFQ